MPRCGGYTKKEGRSFLKKRTKKLLFSAVLPLGTRDSMEKFFASFFQKRSACLSSPGTNRLIRTTRA
jgi:hypothetical protein